MSKIQGRLLVIGDTRPATDIVAWRSNTALSMHQLFLRIHAWRQLLKNIQGQHLALYIRDTFEFIGALLAALQENKRVYLPSDALPTTCISLSHSVSAYLGDFPDEFSPLTPDAALIGTAADSYTLAVPDTAEVVVYTSGSTGEAQAIPKKLTQLLVEVSMLESAFGHLCQTAFIVSTVSHQHIYGLLFKVFWPLDAGRPIQAVSLNFPEELIAATASRDAILVSSPAHLKRFSESTAWADSHHRIVTVFSSGGPLDRQTAIQAEKFIGKMPIEIYGSSETGGIAWRQRHVSSDDSWLPLPGVGWRRNDESGVLEVHSAHLPDSNWFRTADKISVVDDKRFLLQGRVDRIIKIEEKRISLDAVEKQLKASALVDEARIIVVDMEHGGRQRLAAFVVPSAQGKERLDVMGKLAFNRQLRQMLAPSFERVAFPKIWRYLDKLPVNMQGKTSYSELKAMLDTVLPADATDAISRFPVVAVLEQTEQHVLIELTVPDDLIYFQGHFPETPILPGVVQLDWAIRYGQQYFGMPILFDGVQKLKFQRIITPGMSVNLELNYDFQKASMSFRYFSSEGQHASGQIAFGSPEMPIPYIPNKPVEVFSRLNQA